MRVIFKIYYRSKKLTPEDFKKKIQTFLTDIGGAWYPNDKNNPKYPIKRPRLTRKEEQEQGKTKGESKLVCDYYKDWKFHIHWKQLEYFMPIKGDIQNNPFSYI